MTVDCRGCFGVLFCICVVSVYTFKQKLGPLAFIANKLLQADLQSISDLVDVHLASTQGLFLLVGFTINLRCLFWITFKVP